MHGFEPRRSSLDHPQRRRALYHRGGARSRFTGSARPPSSPLRQGGVMTSTALLLHVAHGVSAQPTLSAQLAARSTLAWPVLELEPAEVRHREDVDPAVMWASLPR